jgi:hypothetical protein
MYDNTLNIKDYVTLFLSEADEKPANGIYTWRIPQTYYSNQRSTVCTVSIVAANLTPTSLHNSVLVDYANGGINSYNKKQRHIIGHAQVKDHGAKSFFIDKGNIELLTNARPDKITLKFIKESDALEKEMANGTITLQFCYYNAEETNANYHNEFTRTLK